MITIYINKPSIPNFIKTGSQHTEINKINEFKLSPKICGVTLCDVILLNSFLDK